MLFNILAWDIKLGAEHITKQDVAHLLRLLGRTFCFKALRNKSFVLIYLQETVQCFYC